MVSRIPALFPYIEWDGCGNASLRDASESFSNGCYGKVIPNLMLAGTVWSYRDMISGYWGDALPENIAAIVNRAIGKKDVTWEGLDRDESDLVPLFIYLATARVSLQEMQNLRYMVNLYRIRIRCAEEGQPQCDNESDPEMCCLAEKYERMGGDKMISFLEGCVSEADMIAKEMKGYAEDVFEGKDSLRMEINLPLLNSFKDMGVVRPLIEVWETGKKYWPGQYVIYDGILYRVKDNEDGHAVNGSVYDTTAEVTRFNATVFETAETYVNNHRDVLDRWWDSYCKGRVEYGKKVGDTIQCRGESQLTSLRMYGTYVTPMGDEERPPEGRDWLHYYRKDVVLNVRCEMDDLENVLTVDGDVAMEGDGKNLYAFGDMIKSITLNVTERTLTFEYVIGAHLVNRIEKWKTDDDGNDLYRIVGDWSLDTDTKLKDIGISYKEVFTFDEDSELSDIESDEFTKYIKGDISDPFSKYEFITAHGRVKTDKEFDGISIEVENQVGEMTFKTHPMEYQIIPMVRDEYTLATTYAPEEDVDVYIQRGNAAAFERHIKLSEIKTLDDLLKCATLPVVSSNVVEN